MALIENSLSSHNGIKVCSEGNPRAPFGIYLKAVTLWRQAGVSTKSPCHIATNCAKCENVGQLVGRVFPAVALSGFLQYFSWSAKHHSFMSTWPLFRSDIFIRSRRIVQVALTVSLFWWGCFCLRHHVFSCDENRNLWESDTVTGYSRNSVWANKNATAEKGSGWHE